MVGTVNLVLLACAAILAIWLHSTGALRLTSDPNTSAAVADAGQTSTVKLAINE